MTRVALPNVRSAQRPRLRVLFTGYAHVHFVCFRPLYRRLLNHPDIDVFVSGGLRSEVGGAMVYDARAMYEPLGVPEQRVVQVTQLATQDFDVLFGANTNLIEPRHAGARVQLFHGVSFRNKAIRSENMGCDHYFIVGPYMHRRFVEAGLLTAVDHRAVQVGFPKTDALFDDAVDIGRLRAEHGLGGERPILLYAPTGQKHNSLETMGLEVIRRLAASNRYNIVIKLHDHPKNRDIDWAQQIQGLESDHCRLSRELDVVALMRMADLLITDASSVSSEFSLLNRPMVFLDVPALLEAAAKGGSMLDLSTWGRRGGPIVSQPQEACDAIDDALAHPERFDDVRRSMAADLFYNPGRATDVAMQWFQRTFLADMATVNACGSARS